VGFAPSRLAKLTVELITEIGANLLTPRNFQDRGNPQHIDRRCQEKTPIDGDPEFTIGVKKEPGVKRCGLLTRLF
jgi:hypothetical protein